MGEEKKQVEQYELTEIATQVAPAIKDNVSGEVLDSMALLVKIANDISVIKKSIS